jgi:hypothetical protein
MSSGPITDSITDLCVLKGGDARRVARAGAHQLGWSTPLVSAALQPLVFVGRCADLIDDSALIDQVHRECAPDGGGTKSRVENQATGTGSGSRSRAQTRR